MGLRDVQEATAGGKAQLQMGRRRADASPADCMEPGWHIRRAMPGEYDQRQFGGMG